MFAKTQIAQPSLPPIMALAWAAGLTDGDGCVHIAKQTFSDPKRIHRPNFRIRLTISQSNLPVLQYFQQVVGVTGCVSAPKRTLQQNKQHYSLTYDGAQALTVILKLRPFLVGKLAEVLVVIAFARVCRINEHPGPQGQSPRIWKLREAYYKKLRRMK
jgi:hypothetical protein